MNYLAPVGENLTKTYHYLWLNSLRYNRNFIFNSQYSALTDLTFLQWETLVNRPIMNYLTQVGDNITKTYHYLWLNSLRYNRNFIFNSKYSALTDLIFLQWTTLVNWWVLNHFVQVRKAGIWYRPDVFTTKNLSKMIDHELYHTGRGESH